MNITCREILLTLPLEVQEQIKNNYYECLSRGRGWNRARIEGHLYNSEFYSLHSSINRFDWKNTPEGHTYWLKMAHNADYNYLFQTNLVKNGDW